MASLRKALAALLHLPAIGLIILVRAYQKTLSPDHGLVRHLYPHGYCRHEPTCSEYTIDVLRNRSLPVALWLSLRRIASCNPWTPVSEERLRSVVKKHLGQ